MSKYRTNISMRHLVSECRGWLCHRQGSGFRWWRCSGGRVAVVRGVRTGRDRRWWFRVGIGFLLLDMFGRSMITLIYGYIGVEV